MKTVGRWSFVGFLWILCVAVALPALAEEDTENAYPVSITVVPGRYAAVKGDVEKFRALNWMKDGYVGGIRNLTAHGDFEGGTVWFEGRAFPAENDIRAILEYDKEDFGFFEMDYHSFRKYFDGTGGFYYPFITLSVNELDQDLELDISHFAVEFGPHLGDEAPEIGFYLERHTKNGRKSRLTWVGVKEGATTRNIGPSWQDLDETTDILGFKAGTEFGGFNVNLDQRWEFVRISSMREERNLSTNATASEKKIRRQFQEPETDLMVTTLRAEKWLQDNKSFVGFAYRFQEMDNSENETLSEFDENGNPRSFSNPKNKPNAFAENDLDTHTWTGQYLNRLRKDLNFIAKVKTEVIRRRGNSVYPNDTDDPPNGIGNTAEINTTENKVYRFGENVSLRYNGIARTSLYTEAELEQTRNWLSEELVNVSGEDVASSSGDFSRETLTHIQKTILTAGARIVPSSKVSLTLQARHRIEDNDYDDIHETSGGGSARSAFIDSLKLYGNEITSRIMWKPWKWLQTGFRYQYLDNTYKSRAQAQVPQESLLLSHVFTYDVFLQPLQDILMNLSFSRQNLKVSTPAGSASSTQIPGFIADVNTWLFSTSYTPTEKISLITTFLYSLADNFDDFTATGLPYGVDNKRYDATVELRWSPKDNLTVAPHYAYYNYNTNLTSAEFGDYSAHVTWLDVSMNW
jgi:hypothetical protein